MKHAKIIALFALLISININANENHNINQLSLNNLNLSWQQASGHVNFEELSWHSSVNQTQIKENDFSFDYNENTQKLNFIHDLFSSQFVLSSFKILSIITNLEVNSLYVVFRESSQLSLKLESLSAHIGNDVQKVQQIDLSCQKTNGALDVSTLTQCLANMNLNIDQIIMAAASSQTYYSLFPESITGKKNYLTPKTIHDIKLTTNKNDFHLSFTTKLLIKFKIKIEGSLNFAIDKIAGSQLKIAVSRAKVSIFNVKSLLLFAIKHAKLKNVSVDGDQILIQL